MSAFPRSTIQIAIASLLCVCATSAMAANLVTNPDFNAGLSGWTLTQGSNPTLDDVDGSPSAPSIRLVSVGPNLNSGVSSNCMAAGSAQFFDLIVNVRVHVGFGSVGVAAYSDANCTVVSGPMGYAFPWPLVIDTWQQAYSWRMGLPPGGAYIQVSLNTNQQETDSAQSDVSFDNVRFGPAGTVPVRLQTFTVD